MKKENLSLKNAKLNFRGESSSYLDRQFLNDVGSKKKWFRKDFKTDDWKMIELPKNWKNTENELGVL